MDRKYRDMEHFEREESMQKRGKRHPEEFKRQIVAIYELSDRSAASLSPLQDPLTIFHLYITLCYNTVYQSTREDV